MPSLPDNGPEQANLKLYKYTNFGKLLCEYNSPTSQVAAQKFSFFLQVPAAPNPSNKRNCACPPNRFLLPPVSLTSLVSILHTANLCYTTCDSLAHIRGRCKH